MLRSLSLIICIAIIVGCSMPPDEQLFGVSAEEILTAVGRMAVSKGWTVVNRGEKFVSLIEPKGENDEDRFYMAVYEPDRGRLSLKIYRIVEKFGYEILLSHEPYETFFEDIDSHL